MTVPRALLVLLILLVLGLSLVLIRGAGARSAHRIQRLHSQSIKLEQSLWSIEIELAQMREPQAIRDRAAALGIDLAPQSNSPASTNGN